MTIRSLEDLEKAGKRVFVRVDFNVPLRDGNIQDDTRIRASLPTLEALLQGGASLVVASHLGRPKGQPDLAFSLAPVAKRLQERLGVDVALCPEVAGPRAEQMAAALTPGQVVLLENLRFHPGETKNDPELSKALAALADRYVNDAFGTCHRAHASTVGVPGCFGTQHKAAGLLLQRELRAFDRVLTHPERPLVAVLGGAKVSDKIGLVRNLLTKVDRLLVGGAMAYTFLASQGVSTGDSLVEEDKRELAGEILAAARERGVEVLLPLDHVVARELGEDAATRVTDGPAVEAGWKALDIGPATRRAFASAVAGAHTLVWNGPMGVFEVSPFAAGTLELARAVAACRGFTVVGGGDSVAAVNRAGVAAQIDHVSTGGGASLELLEGATLPGVAALDAGGK